MPHRDTDQSDAIDEEDGELRGGTVGRYQYGIFVTVSEDEREKNESNRRKGTEPFTGIMMSETSEIK